jgi:polysaccharide biosynthesis protein PslH
VMPRVLERLPGFRLLIAGSDPGPRLRDQVRSLPGVALQADPADAIATYRSGRVAVNPARFGSGVSMKLLDMLASGRPVVSTTRGLTGFGDTVSPHVAVADEPAAFASALLAAHRRLADGMVPTSLPERFGLASLKACVDHMKSAVSTSSEVL